MGQNKNSKDSLDEEESLLFVDSSGLDWKSSIEDLLLGIYTWKERVETTGIIDEPKKIKIIKYPFDRYTITVAVSSNNEFIGITEVQLNEDFRSYKLKGSSQFSSEVEDFYFEE
ncbi:MAG: hypothetical protein ACFFC3_11265 [Candidatus Odinarchaeota archaeon]